MHQIATHIRIDYISPCTGASRQIPLVLGLGRGTDEGKLIQYWFLNFHTYVIGCPISWQGVISFRLLEMLIPSLSKTRYTDYISLISKPLRRLETLHSAFMPKGLPMYCSNFQSSSSSRQFAIALAVHMPVKASSASFLFIYSTLNLWSSVSFLSG